jgi:hypothetical protein
MRIFVNRSWVVVSLFFAMFSIPALVGAGAQQQSANGDDLAAHLRENTQQLKQYTHKRKTEVYWKNKLRNTQFAEIDVDAATGKETSVSLGSNNPGQSQPTGLLMAQVKKKISNDIKHNVERMVELRSQYIPPNPDKIRNATPIAQIAPAGGRDTQIKFVDYAQPGDSMTLWINPDSKVVDRIVIDSSLDGKPVSFTNDFATLPSGVSYPSTATMKWEAKELELHISNFDYHRWTGYDRQIGRPNDVQGSAITVQPRASR